MIIGIIGTRRRNEDQDFKKVEQELLYQIRQNVDKEIKLVSGGCPRGGDRFAEELARKYNLPIILHRAEWGKYGKYAGFHRNGDIAKDADILIACVSEDRTGGTEDTIQKYLKMGKHRLVIV